MYELNKCINIAPAKDKISMSMNLIKSPSHVKYNLAFKYIIINKIQDKLYNNYFQVHIF